MCKKQGKIVSIYYLKVLAQRAPQESVLSPPLWIFVMVEFLSRLSTAGFLVVEYANDLFVRVKDMMQQAFRITDVWCNKVGLSVIPSKTEMIFFPEAGKL